VSFVKAHPAAPFTPGYPAQKHLFCVRSSGRFASHLADHWALAWGGFDLGLAAALAATAVAVLRRAWWTQVVASVAGTMLISDAWFDVLTARGRMTVTLAVVEALAAELPLALVCFWLALRVDRLMPEQAAD